MLKHVLSFNKRKSIPATLQNKEDYYRMPTHSFHAHIYTNLKKQDYLVFNVTF